MMINIENLQDAQKLIERATTLAKQGRIGAQLEEADARAEAAYIILNALDEMGAKDTTEIKEETAEKLLTQLKTTLNFLIYGHRKGSESVATLKEYVRLLEQTIRTAQW